MTSFLVGIHSFHFRPPMYWDESMQCTLNTWVVWSEARRKWWRHLGTAPCRFLLQHFPQDSVSEAFFMGKKELCNDIPVTYP